MREVDARGLSCPEPLMLTAEAIKSDSSPVKVLVTEPHQKTFFITKILPLPNSHLVKGARLFTISFYSITTANPSSISSTVVFFP